MVLEKAVCSAGLANKDSLAEERPGGARNGSRDAYGWLSYYRALHRIHAKLMFRETGGDTGDVAAVLGALSETAETVVLVTDAGERSTVFVYPKSFNALTTITTIDARVEWLAKQRKDFLAHGMFADAPELISRIDAELAYQYGLLVWAATTEGPRLPFDPLSLPDEVPEWIYEMAPWHVRLIHLTFFKVNAFRLQAVQQLLNEMSKDADPDGRPSWATFFASTATEQNTTSAGLMRDHSLGSVLGTALIAAETRLAAFAKAEESRRNDG